MTYQPAEGLMPAESEQTYDIKDKFLILMSIFLGLAFTECILFEGLGLSVPVYLTIFYGAVMWYLSGKDVRFSKTGLMLFIPVVLLSACFVLFDNEPLMVFNAFFLFSLVFLHLIYLTGNEFYPKFSFGLIADIFNGIFIMPFGNIGQSVKILGNSGKTRSKTAFSIFIGLVVAIPVLAVVIALLASSDFVFEKMVNEVGKYLQDNVVKYIWKVIWGVVLSLPLLGFLFALRHKKRPVNMKVNVARSQLEFINGATTVTFLSVINIVYVLYIVIQFGYLFQTFRTILPTDYNLSSYARRGFFELCAIVFINLCLFTAVYLFTVKKDGILPTSQKIMLTTLVLSTFILIASALSKVVIYMNEMGLTTLRIYPSWLMVVLTLIFIALFIKIYFEKFEVFKVSFIIFMVMYLALNYANIDRIIANVNYNRYVDKVDEQIDLENYRRLSSDAAPALKLLSESDNKLVSIKAKDILRSQELRVRRMNFNWQNWNLPRYQAQNIFKTVDYE